jgi:hypothetical protein
MHNVAELDHLPHLLMTQDSMIPAQKTEEIYVNFLDYSSITIAS